MCFRSSRQTNEIKSNFYLSTALIIALCCICLVPPTRSKILSCLYCSDEPMLFCNAFNYSTVCHDVSVRIQTKLYFTLSWMTWMYRWLDNVRCIKEEFNVCKIVSDSWLDSGMTKNKSMKIGRPKSLSKPAEKVWNVFTTFVHIQFNIYLFHRRFACGQ